MIKTLKNIRKLDNAKLLVVSSDLEVKKSLEEDLDNYFREVSFVSNNKDALILANQNNYDLVIIDTLCEGLSFKDFCFELVEVAQTLPKIIISAEDDSDDIVTAVNCNAYTFISKPLRLQDLKLAIIMCLNQTKRGDKVEFQGGIYFDEYRDQFFKPGGAAIDFTRLEKGFLKLLIARRGEITDYDTIKEVVWKGKNMSIYTMRNIVNKIRQKTYYEIIKNHSNKGYVIDETGMKRF
ncbi:MAG: DNA-binding response regulator [Arcobacter sp.]|uniref:response regulator transcription factor n=1 Tax=uncultured Arcobacter sp. TaxID=165434 RepID=UPI000CCA8F64|nr:response regulator [uncultured Arcobacter sp.]PLY11436.1 MAG: DNA-binding response regulator [Arcobacter sp.]